MKLARAPTNLEHILQKSTFAVSENCPDMKSREEYQNEKYANLSLATPVLQPVKGTIDIPPLEGFPSPAIPVNADSLLTLSNGSKIDSFHLSPNIENKLEKLQVNLTKKNISDKTTTSEIQFVASPTSEVQSLNTMVSTNQKTDTSDITMVFSEDDEEALQGHLAKSSKGPQSKERKLSNEEGHMLPPRAKDGVQLRPCAKFTSSTIKSSKTDQQPLKPMTILGFLQKSHSDSMQGNTKKRVEKAGLKSLEALSLTASVGKAGSSMPSFTLG